MLSLELNIKLLLFNFVKGAGFQILSLSPDAKSLIILHLKYARVVTVAGSDKDVPK